MPTYHVNYLTGSNTTGDGTAVNPWATVLYACQTGPVAANDTIKVAKTGDELVIDSAATISGLTTINTSVNLIGQLAAGDIFIMSPNVPGFSEFDNYITLEVLTITSTVITVAGTPRLSEQLTGGTNITIKRFTAFVNAGVQAANFDVLTGISAANLTGVTIEGGYDNSFTTVSGITNIFKPGISYAANNGAVLTLPGANNPATFKNFRFSKFSRAINDNTNGAFLADNCYFNNVAGFGNGFNSAGINGGTSTLYFSNSGGGTTIRAYANSNLNIYNTAQTGQLLSVTNVNNLTSFSVGSTGRLSYMGGTTNTSPHIALTGNITGNVVMNAGTSATVRTVLFVSTGEVNSVVQPTSFKLLQATGANSYIFDASIDFNARNFNFICPSGLTIENLGRFTGLSGFQAGDPQRFNWNIFSISDANDTYTGFTGNGLMATTDTTEFITGNSSRKIRVPYTSAGISGIPAIPIAEFKYNNAGQILQSVTIKAKKSSNIAGISTNLYFTNPAIPGNLSASGVTVNSDTFQDYTIAINTTLASWDPEIQRLLFLSTPLLSGTAVENVYLWIDSITFNYA